MPLLEFPSEGDGLRFPVFDSHFHIIDPRFPLVANDGFLPEGFGAADYLRATSGLSITGGVVVSGSFQAFDLTYLSDALTTLGEGFVGVANVPVEASDDDLRELGRSRVRGIRFNLYRGAAPDLIGIVALARRAFDLAGLHAEFYLDAQDLDALHPVLAALPKASIDHLGMTSAHRDVLLRLAAGGVRVKATGFGRVDLDVAETVAQLHAENPEALLFGTDLPSTRARRPFDPGDLGILRNTLPDGARGALYDNGVAFYHPFS